MNVKKIDVEVLKLPSWGEIYDIYDIYEELKQIFEIRPPKFDGETPFDRSWRWRNSLCRKSTHNLGLL